MSLCTGPELRAYIERGLGEPLPENAQFIGQVNGRGEVVAVAALHGWRGEYIDGAWRGWNAEISLWSRRGLTRALMQRVERYVFEELGLARVTCLVRADNPWHEILPRVGFQIEGRIRRGADGVTDLLLFGILPGEFRYVGK